MFWAQKIGGICPALYSDGDVAVLFDLGMGLIIAFNHAMGTLPY